MLLKESFMMSLELWLRMPLWTSSHAQAAYTIKLLQMASGASMNVSFHMELQRCKVSNRHDEQSCPPLNTFALSPDAVDYLLFLHRDVKVQPNPEEVADIQYVNREQLKEIIRKADAGEDGIKLSPWFRIVADNFLLDWWKRVDDGTLAEAADMATIHKLQLKKERSTTSYTAQGYAYNFLGWFPVMWALSWNLLEAGIKIHCRGKSMEI